MQEITAVAEIAEDKSQYAVEMYGISKSWPGVIANDHVNLTVRKGEIHALVGENGAGKSTLMNILYGLIRPDSGEIFINGQLAHISGPRDAIDLGIGMVHQHFMLIPPLTVAENIVLGHEPGSITSTYEAKKARELILSLSNQYGLPIDPDIRVEKLSVGLQQRVEILKVLYRAADILIMDEPTGVLTPQETFELFAVLRGLVAEGQNDHLYHAQIARGVGTIRQYYGAAPWQKRWYAGYQRDQSGRDCPYDGWTRGIVARQ